MDYIDALSVAPGESVQRKRHMTKRFTDQHGRVFTATVDILNGHPVSELVCQARALPWQPPQRYAMFGPPGDHSLMWDYQGMADDLLAETKAYYALAIRAAKKHNQEAPKVGDVVSMEVRAEIGTPPLSPEVPLSAEAEDPWLLGEPGADRNEYLYTLLNQTSLGTESDIRDLIQERVRERVGTKGVTGVQNAQNAARKYNDFVKEMRAQGYPMGEIVSAWHAQKAVQA